MFLASVETALFGENCYVIAAEGADTCVIIDPGRDADPAIAEICAEQDLRPAAVLLTHGHLDHLADVGRVCTRWQIPCWIAAADRALLDDPRSGLSADLAALVAPLWATEPWVVPESVEHYPVEGSGGPVTAGRNPVIEVAGLRFTIASAPGHTPGSVLLGLDAEVTGIGRPVIWTGDVVFAGSVGRTDLPGGDPMVMLDTLRSVVLPIADEAVLLPGHGPQTTMAQERRSNPYLKDL